MAEEVEGDTRRRALTTVDELGERIALVREAAAAAGRPPVEVSTQILFAVYGTRAQVRAEEERLCQTWAKMPYRPLGRSPYLLTGDPAGMADALAERRELYGLTQLSLTERVDPVRFCREVLPLLG
jgi:alkanesulfonate monooxygenase SsuD/methylene tetrahydromethanopterin reductase-like flavin-dependent oxidoreductase (luciferase family)